VCSTATPMCVGGSGRPSAPFRTRAIALARITWLASSAPCAAQTQLSHTSCDDAPQVCDFGIAKMKDRTLLSTRGAGQGTPAYMVRDGSQSCGPSQHGCSAETAATTIHSCDELSCSGFGLRARRLAAAATALRSQRRHCASRSPSPPPRPPVPQAPEQFEGRPVSEKVDVYAVSRGQGRGTRCGPYLSFIHYC
jgi:hypothetical protein